jgi:hypothetical protein
MDDEEDQRGSKDFDAYLSKQLRTASLQVSSPTTTTSLLLKSVSKPCPMGFKQILLADTICVNILTEKQIAFHIF